MRYSPFRSSLNLRLACQDFQLLAISGIVLTSGVKDHWCGTISVPAESCEVQIKSGHIQCAVLMCFHSDWHGRYPWNGTQLEVLARQTLESRGRNWLKLEYRRVRLWWLSILQCLGSYRGKVYTNLLRQIVRSLEWLDHLQGTRLSSITSQNLPRLIKVRRAILLHPMTKPPQVLTHFWPFPVAANSKGSLALIECNNMSAPDRSGKSRSEMVYLYRKEKVAHLFWILD